MENKIYKKIYRILFTGVGRRVELVQAFREAANNLNINLFLYGADITESAPALIFCDYKRKVCGMKDENYIPQLINICLTDKIDLLIPTIDTDLLILSQNIKAFDIIGTKVLISEPDKISLCRDKNLTTKFFEACGLKTPYTLNDYRNYFAPYPCFIKPKDGSSSVNAFKIENKSELKIYAEHIGDYIIQSFIEGEEYTVDIFCDYAGNPIFITPRIRLAVRSGEVLKTKISMDEKIIAEGKKLIQAFKPCGPITVQLIREKNTGDDYYIEINPRFGGGSPLSMKAGAKSAEALLKLLSGEPIKYNQTVDNEAVFSRFDQSVCISQGKRIQQIKGVIFDLDDTLYSEKQYVESGYKAIAKLLGNEIYKDKLWDYFEAGELAIDKLLYELGLSDRREECLEIYREQEPEITLYKGVAEMIKRFKINGIKVGIITDGRVSGQKKKIKALGLEKLVDDIIITDELGGVQFRKPCDIAFRIMQCRWGMPFEQIMYVGDNVTKDFKASKQLGMRSVWFQNKCGLHLDRTFSESIEIIVTDLLDVVQEIFRE